MKSLLDPPLLPRAARGPSCSLWGLQTGNQAPGRDRTSLSSCGVAARCRPPEIAARGLGQELWCRCKNWREPSPAARSWWPKRSSLGEPRGRKSPLSLAWRLTALSSVPERSETQRAALWVVVPEGTVLREERAGKQILSRIQLSAELEDCSEGKGSGSPGLDLHDSLESSCLQGGRHRRV